MKEKAMSKEVWSEIKWTLEDIMVHYEVSEEQASDIAFAVSNLFEDRMIELGWDVLDSLIQTFHLLEEGEDDA
jgi:hypothetical protein